MNKLSRQRLVIRIVLSVVFFAALGCSLLGSNNPPVSADDDVVVDPKSGQRVLVNQLAILGEGQDVRAIVAEYGGTITIAVPETDTYQAKFPVRSLKELDAVAKKLQRRGLKTQYVLVTKPSKSNEAFHPLPISAENLTTVGSVRYKARAMFSTVRHYGYWHHHHHTGGGPAIVLDALNQI